MNESDFFSVYNFGWNAKKTDQNVMLKSGFEQQNYYYQFNLIKKVLLFICPSDCTATNVVSEDPDCDIPLCSTQLPALQ